jgi:hypothetical protein
MGIHDIRLKSVLSLTQEAYRKMFNDIWSLQVYHQREVASSTSKETRTNMKSVYKVSIEMLVKQGLPRDYITKVYVEGITNRGTRASHLKMINDCFDEIDQDNPSLRSKTFDSILQRIGIMPVTA